MSLLQTVKPENAEGKVKEAYDYFNGMAGMIPLPIQMVSTSPDILTNLIDTVKYYVNESNLSTSFLAHIRLFISIDEDYTYCINLNQELLKGMCEYDDGSIDALLNDVNNALLEKKEIELLKFVIKAVSDPATTEKSDIVNLNKAGWTDKDIYEAVNEGLLMLTRGIAFKAFKMAE
ncbi:MAG: hypothetical protein GY714_06190 [Desulfobacterales bacterium]|nr:hypothetical protein [Desulfobacterales bacterium]MCP4162483.1 hypothetical protein [Deltaproteobacteria bacterium]